VYVFGEIIKQLEFCFCFVSTKKILVYSNYQQKNQFLSLVLNITSYYRHVLCI
jgi:hypothetical protein